MTAGIKITTQAEANPTAVLFGAPNCQVLTLHRGQGSGALIQQNYAEAYNNLRTAQAESAQYEQAIENFDRAIKIKPELAVAYYNIGVVSVRLNRREVALKQYGLLTSLDSTLGVKLYNGIYNGKVLALRLR